MMKRQILILLYLLSVNLTYSQTNKYENIYFIKFKVYQKEFNTGVPFAEVCITDKKDSYIFNCTSTDFDGYAFFHINPNKYNIDSTYLRIRILIGNAQNEYGKPIEITLNRISLLKDCTLENDIRITLYDYNILSEKEYERHRKKYGLMPERQPLKAVDVK
ncbi:hypothetical protein SDC9_179916 [bioreactor metagenome]|mgnify:CR=1 FL=1|uniref:Uncharacterized protein n=1 Tax=bioreactor metagenome TaxID=1076179 RepID=A0A645H0C5_9ZZZZ